MSRNRVHPSTTETISITVPLDAGNYGGGWTAPAGGSGQYGYRRIGDEVVVVHRTGSKEYRITIMLTFTPTNFKGRRAWFMCPQCDRRVGRLFWPVYDGWAFRCRHCWHLRYYTQRLTPEWRAREQAEKIMKRLGGGSNLVLDQFPDKPKWLRWATYNRWFDKYEDAAQHYDELSTISMLRLIKWHGW
jgi:hypothetical protein